MQREGWKSSMGKGPKTGSIFSPRCLARGCGGSADLMLPHHPHGLTSSSRANPPGGTSQRKTGSSHGARRAQPSRLPKFPFPGPPGLRLTPGEGDRSEGLCHPPREQEDRKDRDAQPHYPGPGTAAPQTSRSPLTERTRVVGAVHAAVGVQLEVEADAHPAVQPAPPPIRAAPREAARPRRRRGGGRGGGRRGGVAAPLRPAGHLLSPGAGRQGEKEEEEEEGRAHAAGGREEGGRAPHPAPLRALEGGTEHGGEPGRPSPLFITGRRPRTCARPHAPPLPPPSPAADAGLGVHLSGN